MNNSKLEKLEKTLEKGKLKFVVLHGVLGWGVTTAILFSVFQHLMGSSQTVSSIAVSLVAFPIGGMLWGIWMWHVLQKQYKKLQSKAL